MFKCGAGEEYRKSVATIIGEMNQCYKDMSGISHIH